MNFDGHDSTVSTACGGIMSLILYIATGLFLLQQGIAIMGDNDTEFTSANYVVSPEEMHDLTMNDFDDTFNMAFNIRKD